VYRKMPSYDQSRKPKVELKTMCHHLAGSSSQTSVVAMVQKLQVENHYMAWWTSVGKRLFNHSTQTLV
jgi:hypothetical protein